MKKCIYCLKTEKEATFNKTEHIIPQSFGKFEDNTTLNGCVCDECNQYFGNTIDRILARDTLEGFLRHKFLSNKDGEYKSEGGDSKLEILSTEGIFKGAYFAPGVDSITAEIKMYALEKQVGIMSSITKEFKYYDIDAFPSHDKLDKEFIFEDGKIRFYFDLEDEELKEELIKKGYKFTGDFFTPEFDLRKMDDSEFSFTRVVDENISRAVAKIAFNYLAFQQSKEYCLSNKFDKIRKFILLGEGKFNNFVSIHDGRFLNIEQNLNQYVLGHFCSLEFSLHRLIATISLFNMIKYRIVLSNSIEILPSITGIGHYYDIKTMRAYKIERGNARELLRMTGVNILRNRNRI